MDSTKKMVHTRTMLAASAWTYPSKNEDFARSIVQKNLPSEESETHSKEKLTFLAQNQGELSLFLETLAVLLGQIQCAKTVQSISNVSYNMQQQIINQITNHVKMGSSYVFQSNIQAVLQQILNKKLFQNQDTIESAVTTIQTELKKNIKITTPLRGFEQNSKFLTVVREFEKNSQFSTVVKELEKNSKFSTVAREIEKNSKSLTVAREFEQNSELLTVARELEKNSQFSTVAREFEKNSQFSTVAREIEKNSKFSKIAREFGRNSKFLIVAKELRRSSSSSTFRMQTKQDFVRNSKQNLPASIKSVINEPWHQNILVFKESLAFFNSEHFVKNLQFVENKTAADFRKKLLSETKNTSMYFRRKEPNNYLTSNSVLNVQWKKDAASLAETEIETENFTVFLQKHFSTENSTEFQRIAEIGGGDYHHFAEKATVQSVYKNWQMFSKKIMPSKEMKYKMPLVSNTKIGFNNRYELSFAQSRNIFSAFNRQKSEHIQHKNSSLQNSYNWNSTTNPNLFGQIDGNPSHYRDLHYIKNTDLYLQSKTDSFQLSQNKHQYEQSNFLYQHKDISFFARFFKEVYEQNLKQNISQEVDIVQENNNSRLANLNIKMNRDFIKVFLKGLVYSEKGVKREDFVPTNRQGAHSAASLFEKNNYFVAPSLSAKLDTIKTVQLHDFKKWTKGEAARVPRANTRTFVNFPSFRERFDYTQEINKLYKRKTEKHSVFDIQHELQNLAYNSLLFSAKIIGNRQLLQSVSNHSIWNHKEDFFQYENIAGNKLYEGKTENIQPLSVLIENSLSYYKKTNRNFQDNASLNSVLQMLKEYTFNRNDFTSEAFAENAIFNTITKPILQSNQFFYKNIEHNKQLLKYISSTQKLLKQVHKNTLLLSQEKLQKQYQSELFLYRQATEVISEKETFPYSEKNAVYSNNMYEKHEIYLQEANFLHMVNFLKKDASYNIGKISKIFNSDTEHHNGVYEKPEIYLQGDSFLHTANFLKKDVSYNISKISKISKIFDGDIEYHINLLTKYIPSYEKLLKQVHKNTLLLSQEKLQKQYRLELSLRRQATETISEKGVSLYREKDTVHINNVYEKPEIYLQEAGFSHTANFLKKDVSYNISKISKIFNRDIEYHRNLLIKYIPSYEKLLKQVYKNTLLLSQEKLQKQYRTELSLRRQATEAISEKGVSSYLEKDTVHINNVYEKPEIYLQEAGFSHTANFLKKDVSYNISKISKIFNRDIEHHGEVYEKPEIHLQGDSFSHTANFLKKDASYNIGKISKIFNGNMVYHSEVYEKPETHLQEVNFLHTANFLEKYANYNISKIGKIFNGNIEHHRNLLTKYIPSNEKLLKQVHKNTVLLSQENLQKQHQTESSFYGEATEFLLKKIESVYRSNDILHTKKFKEKHRISLNAFNSTHTEAYLEKHVNTAMKIWQKNKEAGFPPTANQNHVNLYNTSKMVFYNKLYQGINDSKVANEKPLAPKAELEALTEIVYKTEQNTKMQTQKNIEQLSETFLEEKQMLWKETLFNEIESKMVTTAERVIKNKQLLFQENISKSEAETPLIEREVPAITEGEFDSLYERIYEKMERAIWSERRRMGQ